MKRQLHIALGISALLGSVNARAQSGYDYFELSYDSVVIDIDRYEYEADGYGFSVSKEFADRFLLLAGFKHFEYDAVDDFEMQQDLYSLGIGYHMPLLDSLDGYGQLLYGGADSELATGGEWDAGLEAALGLRFRPLHNLEFDGSLRFTGYEDPISFTGPELSVTGLMRWYVTEASSIGLGGNYGEYQYSWLGTFRVDFGAGD
jgi:hypothetical protein